jgi:hypothetical protein
MRRTLLHNPNGICQNSPIDLMGSLHNMRFGLWLPLFEELADPGVVARLSADDFTRPDGSY